MSAQQTFEQLMKEEGAINEYASLSAIASRQGERIAIVEQLIAASGACRRLVDSLMLTFQQMPEGYAPIIAHFDALKQAQLRREDGWQKIIFNTKQSWNRKGALQHRGVKDLPTGAMHTVSSLAMLVDEHLNAIVNDLQGMSAASSIQAFLQSVCSDEVITSRIAPGLYVECEVLTDGKWCQEEPLSVLLYAGRWWTFCSKHLDQGRHDAGELSQKLDRQVKEELGVANDLTRTEWAQRIRKGRPLPDNPDFEARVRSELRPKESAVAVPSSDGGLAEALGAALGIDPQDFRDAARGITDDGGFQFEGDK